MRLAALLIGAVAAITLPHQVLATDGPPAGKIYAQELVDHELAAHPRVTAMAIYTIPASGGSIYQAIAGSSGEVGKHADATVLQAITSDKPVEAVNGNSYAAQLPLYDASHRNVGAVAIDFAYRAGTSRAALLVRAERIRDYLSRRISYAANLMQPYRFDKVTPVHTYGQQLVDTVFDEHPDLVILCLHTIPPGKPDTAMTISGCTIGRIGKGPDEDDLGVVRTGKERLEINTDGNRFEDEMAVRDPSGKTIGAIGVVYPYAKGEDKMILRAKAHTIRQEIEGRFRNAAQLLGPALPAGHCAGS